MKNKLVIIIIVVILALILTLKGSENIFQREQTINPEEISENEQSKITNDLGGFCGTSTQSSCNSDADCTKGGCSGQICQSVSEPPSISTCEFLECYVAEQYAVTCGCVNNKCQWYK